MNMPKMGGMPAVSVKMPGRFSAPVTSSGLPTGSGNPTSTIVAKSGGKDGGAHKC